MVPASDGRLAQRQLGDRLAEVVPARLLDAVAPVAEVDLVQVEPEDLVLLQVLLEPRGQHQLLHLALVPPLVRQQEGLHHLLGDGRAAAAHPAAQHATGHAAEHGQVVDPLVLVEPGVLRGDDGLLQHVGDLRRWAPRSAAPARRRRPRLPSLPSTRVATEGAVILEGVEGRQLAGPQPEDQAAHGGAQRGERGEGGEEPAEAAGRSGSRWGGTIAPGRRVLNATRPRSNKDRAAAGIPLTGVLVEEDTKGSHPPRPPLPGRSTHASRLNLRCSRLRRRPHRLPVAAQERRVQDLQGLRGPGRLREDLRLRPVRRVRHRHRLQGRLHLQDRQVRAQARPGGRGPPPGPSAWPTPSAAAARAARTASA